MGALDASRGMETVQLASRAVPIPGPTAEQGVRAAMADQWTRAAMADQGTPWAMAYPGTRAAMAGSPPKKVQNLEGALWRRGH